MLGRMLLTPFDLGEDLSAFVSDFGLIILGIVIMFVVMLYGLAYFSRYIEFMKMRESRYLDADTLNFIDKAFHIIIIFFVIMLSLFLIQTRSDFVRDGMRVAFEYFPAVFVVILILFVVFVFMKVMERLIISLRTRVGKGEDMIESSRFLSLTEIFLKYTIYSLGTVFAVFGGMAALPSGDLKNWVVDNIFGPLSTKWQNFAFVILTLVIAYVLYLLVDSLLGDIKKRSKKFSPRVIDVFRTISKYIFIFVTLVVVALILLSTVVSETEILVIGLGFMIIVAAALMLFSEPVKNSLSGIMLMMADPFDEGDRVKILDNLVCDVREMNLTLTTVKTLKGEIVNIPNSEIMSKSMVNFTRSGRYAMTVEVRVSYDVPHDKVEEILLAAADKTDGITDDPAPNVFGKDVDGNAIKHQLVAYITEPGNMKDIKSELVYNVQELFHQKGITALFSD